MANPKGPMKVFNRQAGLGILQALLATGILGAGATVFMKQFQEAKRLSKSMEYSEEVNELTGNILKILSHKEACVNTLNMMNANKSSTFHDIRTKDNEVVIAKSTQYGSSLVQLDHFYLQDHNGYGDGVKVNPGNAGSTNLYVNFTPRKSTLFAERSIQRKIKLWVLTDASSNIRSCYAMSSGEDAYWKKTTSNPENIYYSDGFVGIGTSEPETNLDVLGWIQTQNNTGDRMLIGGENDNYVLKVRSNIPIVFWNESTAKNAHVVMGDVETNGVLRLRGTETPCNAENAGALRYNDSIKRVQVCNGSHWLTKAIVRWCLPPDRIKKGDDEWVNFHQTDRACSNIYGCKEWRESDQ